MQTFATILQWTIVAAIVFVLATHASGVGNTITSFGNFWTSETRVLTGQ